MADEAIELQLETIVGKIDGLDSFIANIEKSLKPLQAVFNNGVATIRFDDAALKALAALLGQISDASRKFEETLAKTEISIKINDDDIEKFKRVIEDAFSVVLSKMSVQVKQLASASRKGGGGGNGGGNGGGGNGGGSGNATDDLVSEIEDSRGKLKNILDRVERGFKNYNALQADLAGEISEQSTQLVKAGARLSSPLGRFRVDVARQFKRELQGISGSFKSFFEEVETLKSRTAALRVQADAGFVVGAGGGGSDDVEALLEVNRQLKITEGQLARNQQFVIRFANEYNEFSQAVERTITAEQKILAIEDKRLIRAKQIQGTFSSGLTNLFSDTGDTDFDSINTSLELFRNLGQQITNDIKNLSGAIATSKNQADKLGASLKSLQSQRSQVDLDLASIGPDAGRADELLELKTQRALIDERITATRKLISAEKQQQELAQNGISVLIKQSAETRGVKEQLSSLSRVYKESNTVFENAQRSLQRGALEAESLAGVYVTLEESLEKVGTGQRKLSGFLNDTDISVFESVFKRARQRITELTSAIQVLRLQEQAQRAELRSQASAGSGIFTGLDDSNIASKLAELEGNLTRRTDDLVATTRSTMQDFEDIIGLGIQEGVQEGIEATKRFDKLKDQVTTKIREIQNVQGRLGRTTAAIQNPTDSDSIRKSEGEVRKLESEYDSLTKAVQKLSQELTQLDGDTDGEFQAIGAEVRKLEDEFSRLQKKISSDLFGSGQAAANKFFADTLTDGAKKINKLAFEVGSADQKMASLFQVIQRGGAGTVQAVEEFRKLGAQAKTNSLQLSLYVAEVENLIASGVKLSSQDKANLNSARSLINVYNQQAASLNKSDEALKRITKDAKNAGRAFKFYSDDLADSILQNFKFINSMTIVTSVLFGLRTAFTELIEESRALARTLTVLESKNSSFAETQQKLQTAVRDTSIEFGETISTSAEIVKQLGSAGFDTETSLAALNSTMKLVVSTQADAQASAQSIAGIYRVFGEQIQGTGRAADAFKTINDTLISVYKNHQAELDELNQGFRFSASSAQIAGFSFQDTAAFLAVLNDNMIKSGRAGRSLQVIFSRLAKDSGKFSEAFNVDLDPSKSLNEQFVGLLKTLNSRLNQGAISLADLAKNFQNLGLRGAPAFITLVKQFDSVKDTMVELNDEAENTASALSLIVRKSLAKEFESAKQALVDIARQGVEPLKDGLIIVTRVLIFFGNILKAIPFLTIIVSAGLFIAALIAIGQSVLAIIQVVITLSRQFGFLATTALEAAAAIEVENVTILKGTGLMNAFAVVTGRAQAAQTGLAGSSKLAGSVISGSFGKIALIVGGVATVLAIAAVSFAAFSESARDSSRRIEELAVSIGEVDKGSRRLEKFAETLNKLDRQQRESSISGQVLGQSVVDAFDEVGTNLISNASIISSTNQDIAASFGSIKAEAESLISLQETVLENSRKAKTEELTKRLTADFKNAFTPSTLLRTDEGDVGRIETALLRIQEGRTSEGRERIKAIRDSDALIREQVVGRGTQLQDELDGLLGRGKAFEDATKTVDNLLSKALDIKKSALSPDVADELINGVVADVQKKSPVLAKAFKDALEAALSRGTAGLKANVADPIDELIVGTEVLKDTLDNVVDGPLADFNRLRDTFNGITESVRATKDEIQELLKISQSSGSSLNNAAVDNPLANSVLFPAIEFASGSDLQKEVQDRVRIASEKIAAGRNQRITLEDDVFADVLAEQINAITGPSSENLKREVLNRLAASTGQAVIANDTQVNAQIVNDVTQKAETFYRKGEKGSERLKTVLNGGVIKSFEAIVQTLNLGGAESRKLYEILGNANATAIVQSQQQAFEDLADSIVKAALATTTFNDRQKLVNDLQVLRQRGQAFASSRSGVEGDRDIRTSLQERIDNLSAEYAKIFGEISKITRASSLEGDEQGPTISSDVQKTLLESANNRKALVKEELDLYVSQIVALKTLNDLDAVRSNKIQLAVVQSANVLKNLQAEGAQISLNTRLLDKKVKLQIEELREVEKLTGSYRNSREAVLELVSLSDELIRQDQARVAALNEEAALQFDILSRIEQVVDSKNKLAGIEFQALSVITKVADINGQLAKVQDDSRASTSERLRLYSGLVDLAKEYSDIVEKTKGKEDKLLKSLDRRADVLKRIRDQYKEDAGDLSDGLTENLERAFSADPINSAIKLARIYNTSASAIAENQQEYLERFVADVESGAVEATRFAGNLAALGLKTREAGKGVRFFNDRIKELRELQATGFESNFDKAINAGKIDLARRALDDYKGTIDDIAGPDGQKRLELLEKAFSFEQTLFEAEATNIRKIQFELELIGQDRFIASMKTLNDRLVEEVGPGVLSLTNFREALTSDNIRGILEGDVTSEQLGFFKNGDQQANIANERQSTIDRLTDISEAISKLSIGDGKRGLKDTQERAAIVAAINGARDSIGDAGPQIGTSSNPPTISLSSGDIKKVKDVMSEEIQITTVPTKGLSAKTQSLADIKAGISGSTSVVELNKAIDRNTKVQVSAVKRGEIIRRAVEQGRETIKKIDKFGNNALTLESLGINAQGDRVGESITDAPDANQFASNEKLRLDSLGENITTGLVANFSTALKDISQKIVEFTTGTMVPEFASANAETYKGFLETITGIQDAYDNQFDAASTGLKRNETDYLSYLNSIENAERQRVEARLNAEREYREELITTQEVFRDQVTSATSLIFSDLSPAISGIGSSFSEAFFGSSDDNFAEVQKQLSAIFRDGDFFDTGGTVDLDNLGAAVKNIISGAFIQGAAGALGAITSGIGDIVGLSLDEDSGSTVARFIERFADDLPEAATQFSERFQENFQTILQAVGEAAPVIVQTLVDNLPQILDTIVSTLQVQLPGIVQSIGEALPKIVQSLVPAIFSLFGIILQQLPSIIEGLAASIPILLAELIKNLPQLIGAILIGLVNGVIALVVGLIKPIVEFFGGNIDAPQIPTFHTGGMIGGPTDEQLILAQRGEGVLSRRGMMMLGGSDVLNMLNRGEGPDIFHNGGVIGRPMEITSRGSGGGNIDNSSQSYSVNATVNVSGGGDTEAQAEALAKALDKKLSKMAKDRKSKFTKSL